MPDINVNQLAESINNKADLNLLNTSNNTDFVVESYSNGTSWYRVYKSGWVEQGNFLTGVTGTQTITLLKPYNSTNYTITTAFSYTSTINAVRTINNNNKTSSSFQIFKGDDSVVGVYWKAEGQGA